MKFQFIIASLQYVTVPRTDGISKFTATLTRRLPTPVSTPSRPRIVLPSIEDKLETKLRIPRIVANRHTLQIIHSLDSSSERTLSFAFLSLQNFEKNFQIERNVLLLLRSIVIQHRHLYTHIYTHTYKCKSRIKTNGSYSRIESIPIVK